MRRAKTKGHEVGPVQGNAREWMEAQYRATPGLREDVAALVAAFELEAGLVKLRKARGVSQVEAAKLAGVTQPEIARLEAGPMTNTKLSTLVRYTQALGGRLRVQIVGADEPARRRAVEAANRTTRAVARSYARPGLAARG